MSGTGPPPLTCLLAQVDSVPGREDLNGERAAAILREHPGAGLAVFPELFLEGYVEGVERGPGEHAERGLAAIAAAAAETGTAVIVGLAGELGGARTSAAACIDERGELVATCHKSCLFGAEGESLVAAPGPRVVDLAGLRIGVMVCFDMELPEIAREAALAGASALVTVAANMRPYYANHRLHSRARALENLLPHVYVNRVGGEGELTFPGGSRIVDAHGEVRAEAGEDDELLLAELPSPRLPYPDDLDYVEVARARLEGSATRRASEQEGGR